LNIESELEDQSLIFSPRQVESERIVLPATDYRDSKVICQVAREPVTN
jgi:hypothetical protein